MFDADVMPLLVCTTSEHAAHQCFVFCRQTVSPAGKWGQNADNSYKVRRAVVLVFPRVYPYMMARSNLDEDQFRCNVDSIPHLVGALSSCLHCHLPQACLISAVQHHPSFQHHLICPWYVN